MSARLSCLLLVLVRGGAAVLPPSLPPSPLPSPPPPSPPPTHRRRARRRPTAEPATAEPAVESAAKPTFATNASSITTSVTTAKPAAAQPTAQPSAEPAVRYLHRLTALGLPGGRPSWRDDGAHADGLGLRPPGRRCRALLLCADQRRRHSDGRCGALGGRQRCLSDAGTVRRAECHCGRAVPRSAHA
ncbi:hypothetical protein T492DRAFT_162328 [Pavlovales sp. CCMP2436]|nr:hypothetical protein T492DRAFT_162328 [Pavlovales sp. CCMP2436]